MNINRVNAKFFGAGLILACGLSGLGITAAYAVDPTTCSFSVTPTTEYDDQKYNYMFTFSSINSKGQADFIQVPAHTCVASAGKCSGTAIPVTIPFACTDKVNFNRLVVALSQTPKSYQNQGFGYIPVIPSTYTYSSTCGIIVAGITLSLGDQHAPDGNNNFVYNVPARTTCPTS